MLNDAKVAAPYFLQLFRAGLCIELPSTNLALHHLVLSEKIVFILLCLNKISFTELVEETFNLVLISNLRNFLVHFI